MYPVWFAVYPIVNIWSANQLEVSLGQTNVLCLSSIVLSVALMVVYRLVLGNWHRSGVAAILTILVVLKYGFLFRVFAGVRLAGYEVFRHRTLLPAFFVLILMSCVLLRRFSCRQITPLANGLAGLLAIAFGLQALGRYGFLVKERVERPTFPALSLPASVAERPNVVVIVLDEYARGDALKRLFAFDNTPFLNALKNRGFFVLSGSLSNYPYTIGSLGSALNLDYWPGLPDDPLNFGSDEFQLFQLSNNRVMNFFRKIGYQVQTISFCSATDHMAPVDQRVGASAYRGGLWDILARDSILAAFTGFYHPNWPSYLDEERGRFGDHTLRAFELLKNLKLASPTFVFVHVLCPHSPLVFKANGDWIREEENPAGRAYQRFYPEEVRFLNTLVIDAVDTVLKNSPSPPIVVVMSDHGSLLSSMKGADATMAMPDETLIRERMGNLSAIFLPDRRLGAKQIEGFSAVNTFRLILNECFGARLPLLPPKQFWARDEVTRYFAQPVSPR